MQSPVLSREEELYWLALKLVPGPGHPHVGQAAGALPHAASHFPRLAHGTGSARASAARWRSPSPAAAPLRTPPAQHEKMARGRRRGWSPWAIRAIRSRCARSSIRRLCCSPAAASSCCNRICAGRGGNAPSHALRAGGGRAAVGRPGARRPDHRQRHGARHRYRRAQGRAGGGRRHGGGAGLRRGRGVPFGEPQAGGGDRGQGPDRFRVPHGRDRLPAELSRSATASSAA